MPSFKGVLLEGLEIAFIVVAFGSGLGSYTWALIGAVAVMVLIGAAGASWPAASWRNWSAARSSLVSAAADHVRHVLGLDRYVRHHSR